MVSFNISLFALTAIFFNKVNAFTIPSSSQSAITTSLSMAHDKIAATEGDVSRRMAFAKTASTFASIASIVSGNPGLAFAAKSGPTQDELNRIKVGYERMTYLLENFEKETTVCRVRNNWLIDNLLLYNVLMFFFS
jgi:hypothetical protein